MTCLEWKDGPLEIGINTKITQQNAGALPRACVTTDTRHSAGIRQQPKGFCATKKAHLRFNQGWMNSERQIVRFGVHAGNGITVSGDKASWNGPLWTRWTRVGRARTDRRSHKHLYELSFRTHCRVQQVAKWTYLQDLLP